MIEIETKEDRIIFVLKGALDGAENIELPDNLPAGGSIQLKGENITSWNTDFVIDLFDRIKNIPKNPPKFQEVPKSEA